MSTRSPGPYTSAEPDPRARTGPGTRLPPPAIPQPSADHRPSVAVDTFECTGDFSQV